MAITGWILKMGNGKGKCKAIPVAGLNRPWGFQTFWAPRFQDNQHMTVVRLSATRTGRLYPPGNIPGTHLCWRLSRPQDHSTAGRIMSIKNCNETIGYRTCDLPVCSAVPQPTALPRATIREINNLKCKEVLRQQRKVLIFVGVLLKLNRKASFTLGRKIE